MSETLPPRDELGLLNAKPDSMIVASERTMRSPIASRWATGCGAELSHCCVMK